jgi:2'-5' RNA ligase
MKNSTDHQRYFLALVPPEPIFSEAHQLKNYFKEKYNSKASLNSPPHITLHMPFLWKEKKETILLEKLKNFASKQLAFHLHLQNYKAFPPRVIYIDVLANESLLLFQKTLERFCKVEFQLFNANRLDQAYHPHLTLAFRDLKKDLFPVAWQEFEAKEYNRSFRVKEMAVLKHSGTAWEVLSTCLLKDAVQ